MSSIYDNYSHLKCDIPTCSGDVVFLGRFSYKCNKCDKEISYHYVRRHADIQCINNKTGLIFPMVEKGKDSGDLNEN